MKFLWIILMLFAVYFLASAATTDGLLPSGHGTGRATEIIFGPLLVGYSVFRFTRKRRAG